MLKQAALLSRSALITGIVVATVLLAQSPAFAAASLSIEPVTWNVIGLDSNNVNVGPNRFPIGARVCNTGDATATTVAATFIWDSADAYIGLRPGSSSTLSVASLAAAACTDFYFEAEVTRDSNAYNHTRRYHVNATADSLGTVSTPTPRELFVEHLVSQSRNSVSDVQYGPTLGSLASVPNGGTLSLLVGNTYYIKLVGSTATNGYEQIESFINLPNTVFQILDVVTTYSADTSTHVSSPSDRLYGDACSWENDPNSPNYRACNDVGKAGGSITVTYHVKILSVGATNPEPLGTLIYDFSGSSFHYNGDFGVSGRYAYVLDPSAVGIAKSFTPDTITPGGTSTMAVRITNPASAPISGVKFADTFPGSMVVASTPSVSYSGCGAGAFSPALSGGEGAVSFSNGTIAGNSTCTIKLNVTAPAGTYPNTTGHLFINDTTDTGNTASATLTATTTSVACSTGTMAQWTVATTSGSPSPPPPTTQAGNVATATAYHFPVAKQELVTGAASPNTTPDDTSWRTWGYKNDGGYVQFTIDTTSYSAVFMTFNVYPDGNGPSTLVVAYDPTGLGSSFTTIATYTVAGATLTASAWNTKTIDFTGLTNTSGNTIFRISGTGATNDNSGADAYFDVVTFTGCSYSPPPSISKAFSPDPITVNSGVSVLTFTVANTATTPYGAVPLTGVTFSDTLPVGLVIGTPANASTTCTSGSVSAPAGGSTVTLTGASMTAGSTCYVYVDVKGTAAGSYDNVSGYIDSNETDPNKTSNGFATDSLTVLAPPSISKSFGATTILTGTTTTLSFSITNPNLATALGGVAFSDTLPAGATVASSSTAQCGGTLTTTAPSTITLASGSIAANSSCSFSVTVTGATAGTKSNTTGSVSSTNGGTGNTASATLVVKDASPAIGLLKQVGPSATGPWTSFLATNAGSSVYYRVTVENTGDVPLSLVSVGDPNVSLASCTWPDLPVADAFDDDHIATCVVGPVSASSGSHPNTATASGTYSGNTVTDTSTASYATTGLTLDKSVTETYFLAAGNLLHYSYVVTNTGYAPLVGPVTISDSKVSVTCPPLTTVGDGDSYLDPANHPTPGNPAESITCLATYPVTAGDVLAGFVTNLASASAGGVTSNTDTTTVGVPPDLTITKSDGGASTTPGSTVSYTLAYSNAGTQEATGVVITETVPANTTFNPGASTAGWVCVPDNNAGSTCTFTVGAVAGGGGGNVTFAVNVASTVPAGVTEVANTATIADDGSHGPDPAPGNNTGSDTTPVTAAPDLTITKNDGGGSTTPGGTVAYTLSYSNAGTQGATGVVISETVPANTTFNPGASTAGWVCVPDNNAGSTCTFAVGSLGAGSGGNVTFAVTVSNPVPPGVTQIANTATIADDGNNGPDPTPDNNTGSDTTAIAAQSADVGITKTDGSTTYTPGVAISYTITVTNYGPATVTSATVNDAVPAAILSPIFAPSAGSYNAGTGAWTGLSLATGQSATLALSGTVSSGASGNLVNTATVVLPAELGDPTPGNNSVTDTDNAVADLVLDKTGSATAAVGDNVSYTIVVTNAGPSNATGLTIADAVPASVAVSGISCFTIGSASCGSNGSAGNTVLYTSASVAAGAGNRITITILGQIVAATTVNNTATVTVPPELVDPNLANNSDSCSTAIVFDPPSAIKTVTATGLPVIEWRMVWINSGNAAADPVRVVDPIPAGTTFVAGSLTCSPQGSSTQTTCTFEGALNRVVYEGTLGPDYGHFDEASAANEVVITFRTTIAAGVTEVQNQGLANWDEDGDGNVADDIGGGQTPVATDDPGTPPGGDPTVYRLELGIPALGRVGLLLLAAFLASVGVLSLRRT